MAYNFDVADSDFIHWGDAFQDHNVDFTMSCLFYPETNGYIISKWVSSTGLACRLGSGDNTILQVFINAGTGGNVATSSSGAVTTNAWQSLIVTFNDSGSDGSCELRAYIDNVEACSSTTADRIDANANDLGVGNRSTLDRDYDGRIGEFAVWDGTVLDASQRAILADHASPLLVRPPPTLYAPMIRGLQDVIGGNPPTNVNGAAVVEHPRVIYPSPPYIVIPLSAAAAADAMPMAMHSYRQRRVA